MASQRTIRIPVPEPFREFMGDVAELVRQNAPPATTPSDDLLQGDCGYGGLSEDGHFEFVYFPADGGPWTSKLSAAEIEGIADGRQTEVSFGTMERDPWMLPALSIPDAIKKLESIGIGGFKPRWTRADIVAKLGPPGENFERQGVDPWIKYHLPQCQVLFGFNAKRKLKFIQFYPADWRP